MQLEVLKRFDDVEPAEWNALAGEFPFLRHEFLSALQRHGCIGRDYGWIPYFLLLRDGPEGALLAAAPTFLKLNSFGEFVFDFAWAEAYERHGLRYYPKLVAAAPYTPATGPRLLVAPGQERERVAATLAAAVREQAEELGVSSLHWLFPVEHDLETLSADGLLIRDDIQYHWTNDGYADFDAFLEAFTSRKRKKARRERRRVQEQGIEIVRRHGSDMDAEEWTLAHHFYAATFEKKWNIPVLTRDFFAELGRTMGDRIIVVFARIAGRTVAAAILFRGGDTLYGRYWGCDADFHSLHFELCYYQGIEYAIEQGLQRFEPGAQGEHKIARGFLPTWTHSAHWIAEPAFRDAIADYLDRERQLLAAHFRELASGSPFRDRDDGG
ncbi:GNAT family N-acetyltransferase [Halofilum ochraceum]|uniref:GNAT family N-acetyltransferase n=1 Tax=Halofilum ochraceum TaxID=1611323 RepID=UPI00082C6253|nr:GNAT family N-acetyltransferase [Halofilum ochraceum]